jgi:hypothetical protein
MLESNELFKFNFINVFVKIKFHLQLVLYPTSFVESVLAICIFAVSLVD